MKQLFRKKFSWMFTLAIAALVVLPLAAFADNLKDDAASSGNNTIEAGGSTTIKYWIQAQGTCDASDGSAATVTINVPANVAVDTNLSTAGNQNTLTFTLCNSSGNEGNPNNTKSAVFSSSTPGSYSITHTVSDINGTYNTSPADFTLTVNSAVQNQTINVTTPAPVSAVYGSSFNVAATATSGLPVAITSSGVCNGSGSNSASITMTSGTGTCTVQYNQAGNSSYNPAPQVTSNTTAQKANATIVVNGYTGTYDGDAHGATGTATGVGGADLSADLNLGASFTDVPGGTAHWTFSGGTNYNDASGDVAITINKAEVTATAGSGSATYNGATHSPSPCLMSGDYTGDLTCANSPASVGPNAGTYIVSPFVSGTGLGNFEVTLVDGSFTINKANASITVTPYNVTYDGNAHTATGTATGVNGEDLSGLLDLSGTTHTNVGSYSDSWFFAGNGNYNSASGTVDDNIAKANANITVTPYNVTYDGNAHTATGTATGVNGEDLSGLLDLSGTTHTNVGSYSDSWFFAGNGNYNFANGTVNDVILAWTLNGFYQPVDMNGVYNVVKGGSTVPLKFEVFAGSTEKTATSVVKSFVQTKIACDGTLPVDDIEFTTTGGTSLRYDATAGQFIQNWKTPTGAGTCYRVTMTTQDGSSLVAFFKLK